MASRTAFCAVVSTTGRRSAKLRRSPFTAYDRAGNVTFRPLPPRRSQMLKPISFRPASGDSPPKCSSASASLPAGLPRSFGVILTVMVFELWLVCIVLLLVGNRDWFLREEARNHHASRRGQKRRARRPRPPATAPSVSRSYERRFILARPAYAGELGAGRGRSR